MEEQIKIWYTWEFEDEPCGHQHRTFIAAENCGLRIVRAALRGEEFGAPCSSATLRRVMAGPEVDEYGTTLRTAVSSYVVRHAGI